ncbi:MAG: hypothetical protein ACTS2F_30965 [Thainema sp.]
MRSTFASIQNCTGLVEVSLAARHRDQYEGSEPVAAKNPDFGQE